MSQFGIGLGLAGPPALRQNAARYGPLALDAYPGAVAAYSLRLLRIAHRELPVVRVRRSSDNAEANFTAAEVTDGTLLAWVGAGNGFVRTWYDQSGADRHLQQATAADQPKLVDGGSYQNFGSGKPYVDFADGKNISIADSPLRREWTYIGAARAINDDSMVVTESRFRVQANTSNNNNRIRSDVGFNATTTSGWQVDSVWGMEILTAPNASLRRNGNEVASGDNYTSNPTEGRIGIGRSGGHNSRHPEALFYNEILSSDMRAGIEADLIQYYL